MARIQATEVPKIARGGKESIYKTQMDEFAELLDEDNFGAGEACVFDIPLKKDDNGADIAGKFHLDPLVTALRKVGTDKGRKVKTASKDGKLYVQDGGPVGEPEETENDSAKAVRKGAGSGAKAKA